MSFSIKLWSCLEAVLSLPKSKYHIYTEAHQGSDVFKQELKHFFIFRSPSIYLQFINNFYT